MHFTWTFTLGDVLNWASLVGAVLVGIYKYMALVRAYEVEHEILIDDYCARHNIDRSRLPTRRNRRP